MTRRLHIPAALAALLAALPCAAFNQTEALGRFVKVPVSIPPYCWPSDLSIEDAIPVSASTYRSICGLGDMALERLYVPSEGGWASAPDGYALSAMAEDGWETPVAARHKQLYDLAYSCLTTPAPRFDLPNGVKVYPLTYDREIYMSNIEHYWSETVPTPNVNDSGLGAACGGFGFAGEKAATPIIADLRAMLSSYGFGGPAADPEAARAAAVASAMKSYRADASISGASFAASNYLARGGIKAGDPLLAVDPFAANWWMSRTSAVPALVPASALPTVSNEVEVTVYELRATAADVAATARSLVMSGGGEATVPSTLSTQHLEGGSEDGPPRLALDVVYTRDYAQPSVKATVRRTERATVPGAGESVGTTRVTSPTVGTLTVSRKRIEGTTTYEVVGAKSSGGAILDAKTNTFTYPHTTIKPSVGWPHASSAGKVLNASASAFGRRTRRKTFNGSVQSEKVEYGAYYGGQNENVVDDVLNYALVRYYSLIGDGIVPWSDDQLGTVRMIVELPDLSATTWQKYVYKSVFVADDPEWTPPEGGDGTYYHGEPPNTAYGRWPFDPTADPSDNDWDGDGYGDGENDPKPTENPDTGYPRITEDDKDCSVWVGREGEPNGNGMGYTSKDECVFERPSALLLVKFNFLSF